MFYIFWFQNYLQVKLNVMWSKFYYYTAYNIIFSYLQNQVRGRTESISYAYPMPSPQLGQTWFVHLLLILEPNHASALGILKWETFEKASHSHLCSKGPIKRQTDRKYFIWKKKSSGISNLFVLNPYIAEIQSQGRSFFKPFTHI